MCRPTRNLCQQVGTANHVIEGFRTDRRQNFTHFLSVECDQVHNLVRVTSVFGPQFRILRTDAHRTCVRLTLTYHDTAHRDQGRCSDTVFFGTQHRSHHDITTCAQTTIGPQGNAFAQVVHCQNLMRLGQTHLPWQTRIFDRGCRRRTCAAIVTRDQNDVGFRFGNTSRNRADA